VYFEIDKLRLVLPNLQLSEVQEMFFLSIFHAKLVIHLSDNKTFINCRTFNSLLKLHQTHEIVEKNRTFADDIF
jgi:hypothetical protein